MLNVALLGASGRMGRTLVPLIAAPARLGCTIGPPQDSAYAVEPVEVEMMKPSPPCVLT
jgi:dihydrodipicolinate reductase